MAKNNTLPSQRQYRIELNQLIKSIKTKNKYNSKDNRKMFYTFKTSKNES